MDPSSVDIGNEYWFSDRQERHGLRSWIGEGGDVAESGTFGADEPRNESIGRLEGARPQREPLPVAQYHGQPERSEPLHQGDDSDGRQGAHDQHGRHQHGNAAGDGQQQHRGRQQEEHEDQVGHREPAVFGRGLAQEFGHGNGDAGARHREEEQNARDVEQEVAQRDLQRVAQLLRFGRQGGDQRRGRRPDVGAQRQRVDAFQADDAHAHQRRQCRREHRTALHQERHESADQQRQVVGDPRHVRHVGVDHPSDDVR